jgi:alpha-beta hydrolase superfamily lysophospholipase
MCGIWFVGTMNEECCTLFADMEEYRRKSRFLYGESMGGAVALLLHRKDPTFWDGAVLAAPMCKVHISLN